MVLSARVPDIRDLSGRGQSHTICTIWVTTRSNINNPRRETAMSNMKDHTTRGTPPSVLMPALLAAASPVCAHESITCEAPDPCKPKVLPVAGIQLHALPSKQGRSSEHGMQCRDDLRKDGMGRAGVDTHMRHKRLETSHPYGAQVPWHARLELGANLGWALNPTC